MKRIIFLRKTILCSIILILGCLFSCQKKTENKSDFQPFSNFYAKDTLFMDVDMEHAVWSGIEIPTKKQIKEGAFVTKFSYIPKDKKKNYFYKIYYQNESYKFPETDTLCVENFYGSWENTYVGFKPMKGDGICLDTIRIVGNPRDEKIFYGRHQLDNDAINLEVERLKANINGTPEWLDAVKQKARDNKISLEEQLYKDALWMINNESMNEGDENHRWKRNPRMGCYKFMLVVVDEDALAKIPDYLQDISKTNAKGAFVNPFYYFLYGDGVKFPDAEVVLSDQILKVRACLNPMEGVYVDPFKLLQEHPDEQFFNNFCNENPALYDRAHFSQYFHSIDHDYWLKNIPDVRDVLHDPYTRSEYFKGTTKYTDAQLIHDHTYNADNACEYVMVDTIRKGIVLKNAGNLGKSHPRKQNSGIISRIGFNYGKIRGKIKFPELLNDEYVFNGLTNAFWLIYQSESPWNARRPSKSGYIPKNLMDEESLKQKVSVANYSEIDIEIVKAAKDWWERDIKKNGNGFDNNNVMFTCTNWDLASQDPSRFSVDKNSITYQNEKHETFRWTNHYKALSLKTSVSDDEMFKPDFYYYEIEWRPTEIIWRIGPSPDKMRVCGYMNDKITMIPNNQMLCIVTQEFHYGEWWPAQPYHQNFVPFPKNDIEGIVYEIVIE